MLEIMAVDMPYSIDVCTASSATDVHGTSVKELGAPIRCRTISSPVV